MEKLIIGRITSYRMQCPQCGEHNISGTKTFYCSECDLEYSRKTSNKTRLIIGTKKRRRTITINLKKELLKSQKNKCYWCGREFGLWYLKEKDNIFKQLKAVGDHKIPYNYCSHSNKDNFCLACDICNGLKQDKMFKNEFDCSDFLNKQWNKKLEKGYIVLLE